MTIYLATVIGWYLVIVGALILFRHDQLQPTIYEILAHRAILFVLAIITLILGLLMVVSHNIWVWDWPVIITLLCWLVLVSGLFRLFFPDQAIRMGKSFLHHPVRMKITSAVLIIVGLFLLYQVYSLYF